MTELFPGQMCSQTGIWVPSNNPNFYPLDYVNQVMRRHFTEGDLMPATPHGEPSWCFEGQDSRPLQDFTGLSPAEIQAKMSGISNDHSK